MNIRRTLAVAAASVVALSASIAPAQAQNAGGIFDGANQFIDNFNCDLLRTGLVNGGLVTNETTRSELAATLRTSADLGDIDPTFALLGAAYAERIANRALTCEIVKADPQQDILAQLQSISSNLSS